MRQFVLISITSLYLKDDFQQDFFWGEVSDVLIIPDAFYVCQGPGVGELVIPGVEEVSDVASGRAGPCGGVASAGGSVSVDDGPTVRVPVITVWGVTGAAARDYRWDCGWRLYLASRNGKHLTFREGVGVGDVIDADNRVHSYAEAARYSREGVARLDGVLARAHRREWEGRVGGRWNGGYQEAYLLAAAATSHVTTDDGRHEREAQYDPEQVSTKPHLRRTILDNARSRHRGYDHRGETGIVQGQRLRECRGHGCRLRLKLWLN